MDFGFGSNRVNLWILCIVMSELVELYKEKGENITSQEILQGRLKQINARLTIILTEQSKKGVNNVRDNEQNQPVDIVDR